MIDRFDLGLMDEARWRETLSTMAGCKGQELWDIQRTLYEDRLVILGHLEKYVGRMEAGDMLMSNKYQAETGLILDQKSLVAALARMPSPQQALF